MKFEPKSENDLGGIKLLEDGEYDFTVSEAKDTVSKSGNEMIELRLIVWDKEGKDRFIFDYLLEAMAYKLRHFCEVTELLDKYESGELKAHDCLARSGKLLLGLQKGKEKPDGGTYPDKNHVKDYIKKQDDQNNKEVKKDEFISDDVPF